MPTTTGSLAKKPSASALPICSWVYLDQMCLGRIGMYAWVSRVVGNSVSTTRVSGSEQVTVLAPVLVRYGSR